MIEPGFSLSDNNLEVSNKIKYLTLYYRTKMTDDDDDIHKRHKMCAQVCSVWSYWEVSVLSIQNTIILHTYAQTTPPGAAP